MKKYKISANLIRFIKHLSDNSTRAVLLNGSIGNRFNIFLERIMTDALEDHEALSASEAEQSPISALLMTSLT